MERLSFRLRDENNRCHLLWMTNEIIDYLKGTLPYKTIRVGFECVLVTDNAKCHY